MRISDWSSDVCSSDLLAVRPIALKSPKQESSRPRWAPHVSDDWRDTAMSKEVQFTMKLEPELRDQFMAEAEAAHLPASQVVREVMREFVQRQRQTREYDEFLQRNVGTAPAPMRSGRSSAEHTSERQSLMRISYAACC